ncbi:hypothetical protein [Streptomyces sp. SID3343]|uniref:hypothetical protein n=1 Tax=Streptomyces sp. SID3343 TaxID=2690260 RepID=UPI001370016B|nr:hypothetical protein [Streptomyces sp. SID3343]MYW05442.1 hypothetical protein [Streptomyces sp. SID3343]
MPYAWLEQTRPGGRILTPWVGGGDGRGHLLALDVDDTGTATGRFVGDSAFMTLTGHDDPTWTGPCTERPDRDSAVDPAELADPTLLSVLGIVLPDVRIATHVDEAGHLRAQAWGPDATYAMAVSDPDGDHPAWTWGPHDLWAHVETAAAWWHTAGRPGSGDFVYTVTSQRQFVTFGGADGPRWDVPV